MPKWKKAKKILVIDSRGEIDLEEVVEMKKVYGNVERIRQRVRQRCRII